MGPALYSPVSWLRFVFWFVFLFFLNPDISFFQVCSQISGYGEVLLESLLLLSF